MVTVLMAMLLLSSPTVAIAMNRDEQPGEVPFGEVPYYAAIEIADADWIAAVFYRPPECVPAMFNLWSLVDYEQSWSCGPSTTRGFMLWEGKSGSSNGPNLFLLKGKGAVPVWFVSLTEFDAASSDGVLTIGELAALPSLVRGTADEYRETLDPYPLSAATQMKIEARGTLEDGRAFRLQYKYSDARSSARIKFGP